jgi:hypothetical protein
VVTDTRVDHLEREPTYALGPFGVREEPDCGAGQRNGRILVERGRRQCVEQGRDVVDALCGRPGQACPSVCERGVRGGLDGDPRPVHS